MTHSTHKARYQVLDLEISIKADTEAPLKYLERDFSWFRVEPGSQQTSKKTTSNKLTILVSEKNNEIKINDLILPIKDQPNPYSGAYQLILKQMIRGFANHFLLHAGVVAKGQKVLIITGPPGAGKTTMVMSLLKKGFVFFSDDFCPVDVKMHLIQPFPRSLWFKKTDKEFQTKDPELNLRTKKVPVSPNDLEYPVSKDPGKMVCLISLDPGDDNPENRLCDLRVQLNEQEDPGFLKAMSALKGVSIIRKDLDLSIKYPLGQGLTSRIKELIYQHENQIWDFFRNINVTPDFTPDPVLTPLKTHEAAFSLMQDLKQDFLFKTGGASLNFKPGAFFVELNKLLQNVDCYKLRVGDQETMVDHVLKAFERAEKGTSH